MKVVSTVLVALRPSEVGQGVCKRPALATKLAPPVIVAGVAANVDHAMDRGGAAPGAASWPIEFAIVEVMLALRFVVPVERIGFSEQGRNPGRHVDHQC